jgi:hypothetical protein
MALAVMDGPQEPRESPRQRMTDGWLVCSMVENRLRQTDLIRVLMPLNRAVESVTHIMINQESPFLPSRLSRFSLLPDLLTQKVTESLGADAPNFQDSPKCCLDGRTIKMVQQPRLARRRFLVQDSLFNERHSKVEEVSA